MEDPLEGQVETVQLANDSKINIIKDYYIRPEQSANVLFNFMKKLEYLKMILANRAMIPRYYEETIDYLNIDGLDRIAFPMTCFCDIHLNKLIPHMDFYGSYGIGLDKKWGIEQGIQPIHYINKLSDLKNDFCYVFSNSLNLSDEERSKVREYNNYLLTSLLFMKPMDGKMLRKNEYVKRNFHDEKEWRYVPNLKKVNTELQLVIPQEQLNPKAYNAYSNGLHQHEQLWLKFKYEIIKYLIVENDNDRKELIKFIINDIKVEDEEKSILVSKILVFDELKEDW